MKQTILDKTIKDIYVALFGHNFVHIEKLVPKDHKKVVSILDSFEQEIRGQIRKNVIQVMNHHTTQREDGLYINESGIDEILALLSPQKEKEEKECKCHCHRDLAAGCQCNMCEQGLISCPHCNKEVGR